MSDLFANAGPDHIQLLDADVTYWVRADLGRSADSLFDTLLNETDWRQEKVSIWGKTHMQPRLVAWYGDPGKSYRYSGLRLHPAPWTPALLDIRTHVERACGAQFNSVLLNHYRDQNDSMGFHSDDEPELGNEPTIASVSLGEERTLIFKSKHDKSTKSVKLRLAHGSLLLMKGATQDNWLHGINKESRLCRPRVNLTFRLIH